MRIGLIDPMTSNERFLEPKRSWYTLMRQSNISYGVGLNAQVHSTLTLALDLLGRWTQREMVSWTTQIDLALGARWNPFGPFLLERGTYSAQ